MVFHQGENIKQVYLMVKARKSLMAIGGNIENMSRILKKYEQND